jgi:hypothetical protein
MGGTCAVALAVLAVIVVNARLNDVFDAEIGIGFGENFDDFPFGGDGARKHQK